MNFDSYDTPHNYLVLIEIDRPVQALASLPGQLSKVCTEAPKLIWRTTTTLGFGATSKRGPAQLLDSISEVLNKAKAKDVVIVELGRAWFARYETTLAGWLHTHLSNPGTDSEAGKSAK